MTLAKYVLTSLLVTGGISPAQAAPDGPAASIADSPAPTWSFAIGFGRGAISGANKERFSTGVSSSLQLGYRLGATLELQLNGDYTSFARFDLDPSKAQQQSALTLGARWAPFESRKRNNFLHINLANVHVKGGLGVGHLVRTPYETRNPYETSQGKWGGAITAGLGWMPIRGPAYEMGLEASDSFVVYRGETRHNAGLNLIVKIDLF